MKLPLASLFALPPATFDTPCASLLPPPPRLSLPPLGLDPEPEPAVRRVERAPVTATLRRTGLALVLVEDSETGEVVATFVDRPVILDGERIFAAARGGDVPAALNRAIDALDLDSFADG